MILISSEGLENLELSTSKTSEKVEFNNLGGRSPALFEVRKNLLSRGSDLSKIKCRKSVYQSWSLATILVPNNERQIWAKLIKFVG